MAELQELKPSYASTGMADKLLDLFRRVTPQRIDAKFIVDNGITTSANASTALSLAKWLGLIDKDGMVVGEKVSKLKLVGDARNTYIAELVKTSYKDLFERIDLELANRDDVANYFVHNFDFGTSAAQQAANLFLHLCQTYGIPISENLKKRVQAPSSQPRTRPAKRTQTAKTGVQQQQTEEKNADDQQRKGSGIEIIVRGFGLESNQQNTMIARSPSELETVLSTEFKALMEYSKILLKKVKSNTPDRSNIDFSEDP